MDNIMQQRIDECVEEFRKKLEEQYKEPELTGTKFECLDTDNNLFIADAQQIDVGTLLIISDWEAFRILETSVQQPWITYTGETYTHERFADLMRREYNKPRVLHWGL